MARKSRQEPVRPEIQSILNQLKFTPGAVTTVRAARLVEEAFDATMWLPGRVEDLDARGRPDHVAKALNVVSATDLFDPSFEKAAGRMTSSLDRQAYLDHLREARFRVPAMREILAKNVKAPTAKRMRKPGAQQKWRPFCAAVVPAYEKITGKKASASKGPTGSNKGPFAKFCLAIIKATGGLSGLNDRVILDKIVNTMRAYKLASRKNQN